MKPVPALARLGEQSARWPIQVIVLTSIFTCMVYCSLANISVNSFLSPLSRTYFVDSPASWTPSSCTADVPPYPHFVGAPLSFHDSAANSSARDVVLSRLTALGALKASPSSLIISQDDFLAWSAQVREFDVPTPNGIEKWHLKTSFSWIVWAKWCFHSLGDLVRDTDVFDLLVVGSAYLAMYYVFFRLWQSFNRLGSKSYLFAATLVGSTFSFMTAYTITSLMGIAVNLRTLSQGIPFFVLVVGFDIKVALSRDALNLLKKPASRDLESTEVIRQVLESRGPRIFREYGIEVLLLLVTSLSRVAGVWEFAALGALILIMDALFMSTFFAAALSLKLTMIRVERNDVIRRALEEDGVDQHAAEQYADQATHTHVSQNSSWSGAWGLVKALVISAGILVNWLQIWSFPISPWFSFKDVWDEPDILEFAAAVPPQSIVTVLPTMSFVPDTGSWYLGRLIAIGRNDPLVFRFIVTALAASIILNIYLLSLAGKLSSVQVVEKRVPVVVERRKTIVSDAPPALEKITGSDSAKINGTTSATRSSEDYAAIVKAGLTKELSNEEVVELGVNGKIPLYALEKQLDDTTRAVVVRRAIVSRQSRTKTLEDSLLPYQSYNYDRVFGACCENVIGYLPLPIGVAGPISIDGKDFFLPLATTEGVLVASTMRGCKVINAGGGVTTEILQDGMTRGPCVSFNSASRAAAAKRWLDSEEGIRAMKKAFDSTSRFARLTNMKATIAGNLLFVRFRAQTGDAMGMNMISKGVEKALDFMSEEAGFEDMNVVSISGNYCTDKKAAAVNWIEGRGKSVVAEAIVPEKLVRTVLKTTVDDIIEVNNSKNLVGSAVAGALGGFNAHAANLVAAIFLATGQDPAQVVEGSNCITLMTNMNGDLHVSVTMPSLEVGTIGGGTILEPQSAMLDMLGIKGPHPTTPGHNAQQLARIVASGVLAGELSLLAAQSAGHLVRAHMQHNRSKAPSAAPSAAPSVAPSAASTAPSSANTSSVNLAGN